jgi:hypothetical protein
MSVGVMAYHDKEQVAKVDREGGNADVLVKRCNPVSTIAAIQHLQLAHLHPVDVVLVLEGRASKVRRREEDESCTTLNQ